MSAKSAGARSGRSARMSNPRHRASPAPRGGALTPLVRGSAKTWTLPIERHPQDFTEAREEARRAIVAWLAGRDPARPPSPMITARLSPRRLDATRSAQVRRRPDAGRSRPSPNCDRRSPRGSGIFETITMQVIEQFQQSRPLVAGNRNLAHPPRCWNWAIKKGLTSQTPFRVLHVPAITLQPEHARRLREAKKRSRAGGYAHGASDCGRYRARLPGGRVALSLQWHQVRFSPKAELFLPAGKTKAKKGPQSPDFHRPPAPCLKPQARPRRLSTPPREAYVFGDEIGPR